VAAAVAPRAVVVLTSARSGSSVTTHALQVLGVDLGDRLRKAAGKNPKGFFEDSEIIALSRRLRKHLIGGRRLALVPDARWQHPRVAALEDEAVTLLRRRFGESPIWGFKTGRTLRFLPFWERVLERCGVETQYVVALRNPMASATSRREARQARFLDQDPGVALNVFQWLVEIVPYFERLRGRPFVVVEFDQLTAHPRAQLERLAQRLQLTTAADAYADFAGTFLDDGLRHQRHDVAHLDTSPLVHPLARDAYHWLHAFACDTLTADDAAVWADWSRIRQELLALAPLLNGPTPFLAALGNRLRRNRNGR
ncbi:MAG: sulfotransferase family protein, partial [Pseudomonadales bacterium]